MYLALPRELTYEQNLSLVLEYCQKEFVAKGMYCCIFYHDKDDGTTGEVLTAMIADKILHRQFEKSLPKADDIGYNTNKVPLEQMPGLREEAS